MTAALTFLSVTLRQSLAPTQRTQLDRKQLIGIAGLDQDVIHPCLGVLRFVLGKDNGGHCGGGR